jgi:excisionase family DNA binding protein
VFFNQGEMTPMEKLICPKEAAEMLGIKPDTLYRWTAERRIPFLKIEGAIRFRPSALADWIRAREFSPKADGREQPPAE